MGKNQYGANALFQRASEHAGGRGGFKKIKTRGAVLPFDCCCLTFRHVDDLPVALVDGASAFVFRLDALLPWLKATPVSPVTGQPASLKDVVRLKFHRNRDGKIHCPVTFKIFNKQSHIVCVRTEESLLSSSAKSEVANVYEAAAIKELCAGASNLADPISGLSFRRKDVLNIQDPTKAQGNGDRTKFYHYIVRQQAATPGSQQAASAGSNAASDATTTTVGLRSSTGLLLNASTARIFEEMKKSLSSSSSTSPSSSSSTTLLAKTSVSDRAALSIYTSGQCAAGFTSTSAAAITSNKRRPVTVMESLEKRWKAIKLLKKDGLVTVETSLGTMLIQLYFSQAPIACDNFAMHCADGYYVGTSFHRVIPGFMAQGGDPTGTGRGGESAFAVKGGTKTFRDEFTDLRHDARGVLAMANSGPGTNGSQFYITFAPTPHLNSKHTVFGKLISGASVLDKIEKSPVDRATDRPKRPITILSTSVSERPEPLSVKERPANDLESASVPVQNASQVASEKISNAELGMASSVGALFSANKKRKSLAAPVSSNIGNAMAKKSSGSRSKKKKKGKFGNFSGW